MKQSCLNGQCGFYEVGTVFRVENLLYPPDISFTAVYVLYSVCWHPLDPQDIKT